MPACQRGPADSHGLDVGVFEESRLGLTGILHFRSSHVVHQGEHVEGSLRRWGKPLSMTLGPQVLCVAVVSVHESHPGPCDVVRSTP